MLREHTWDRVGTNFIRFSLEAAVCIPKASLSLADLRLDWHMASGGRVGGVISYGRRS